MNASKAKAPVVIFIDREPPRTTRYSLSDFLVARAASGGLELPPEQRDIVTTSTAGTATDLVHNILDKATGSYDAISSGAASNSATFHIGNLNISESPSSLHVTTAKVSDGQQRLANSLLVIAAVRRIAVEYAIAGAIKPKQLKGILRYVNSMLYRLGTSRAHVPVFTLGQDTNGKDSFERIMRPVKWTTTTDADGVITKTPRLATDRAQTGPGRPRADAVKDHFKVIYEKLNPYIASKITKKSTAHTRISEFLRNFTNSCYLDVLVDDSGTDTTQGFYEINSTATSLSPSDEVKSRAARHFPDIQSRADFGASYNRLLRHHNTAERTRVLRQALYVVSPNLHGNAATLPAHFEEAVKAAADPVKFIEDFLYAVATIIHYAGTHEFQHEDYPTTGLKETRSLANARDRAIELLRLTSNQNWPMMAAAMHIADKEFNHKTALLTDLGPEIAQMCWTHNLLENGRVSQMAVKMRSIAAECAKVADGSQPLTRTELVKKIRAILNERKLDEAAVLNLLNSHAVSKFTTGRHGAMWIFAETFCGTMVGSADVDGDHVKAFSILPEGSPMISSAANRTLLAKDVNRSVKAMDFPQKRDAAFAISPLYFTRALTAFESFGPKEARIYEVWRNEQLAKILTAPEGKAPTLEALNTWIARNADFIQSLTEDVEVGEDEAPSATVSAADVHGSDEFIATVNVTMDTRKQGALAGGWGKRSL